MKRRFRMRAISILLIITMIAAIIPEGSVYVSAEPEETGKTALDYAIFSGNKKRDFRMSCWKADIKGNVYTGGDFNYSGSELYIHGDVDAGGKIRTNGWKMEIENRNPNTPVVSMPDLDEIIHENAGPYEYFKGSKKYNQKDLIIDKSIKVEDDIKFNSSLFKGNAYIIAGGDINYNVNKLNYQDDSNILLYSQDGDIKISGNDININGIIYAPNGKVELSTNKFTLNG